MKHQDLFTEPDHPEVVEGEFEAPDEAAKEVLFKRVKARAKSGHTEDIGANEPAHVIQLSVPEDGGKLELWWNPDFPADEDNPLEKGGGSVTRTTYIKDESGKIVGATETRYDLSYNPDGRHIRKEVDSGDMPADEKAKSALLGEVQAAEPLSPGEAQLLGGNVLRHLLSAESTEDFRARQQDELEVGFNDVSKAEVNNL